MSRNYVKYTYLYYFVCFSELASKFKVCKNDCGKLVYWAIVLDDKLKIFTNFLFWIKYAPPSPTQTHENGCHLMSHNKSQFTSNLCGSGSHITPKTLILCPKCYVVVAQYQWIKSIPLYSLTVYMTGGDSLLVSLLCLYLPIAIARERILLRNSTKNILISWKLLDLFLEKYFKPWRTNINIKTYCQHSSKLWNQMSKTSWLDDDI